MNTNKFLVGGIIGGVASFLLGWLVWGMLLMNFFKEHSNQASGIFYDDKHMVWWAMIVANLFFGLLISYILNKGGGASAGAGASTGAVVGLLFGVGVDCYLYGQMNIFDTTWMAVDIVASVVVTAIVGGVIGWYLGMGKKAA